MFTKIPNLTVLRYKGKCSKCNKETTHRFQGGTLFTDRYRCTKCNNITTIKTY